MFKRIILGISRRRFIRILSFGLALILVLGVFAFTGYNLSVQYRTRLEYTYQRALDELGQYVRNINFNLKKGMYAGTPAQFGMLSSEMWKDAAAAKSSLGQLPVGELALESTNTFLSQVGNFAQSLAKKMDNGESITDDERENLSKLSKFATELSEKIATILDEINAGLLRIGEVKDVIQSEGEPEDNTSVGDSLLQNEESFSEYPALIYDGPFSDHIYQQEAQALKNKEEVSQEKAREIGAKFVGRSSGALNDAGMETSAIESYNFSSDDLFINVTKYGGSVSYFTNSRSIGEDKLSLEEAVAKAHEFLKQHGMDSFSESYYYSSGGVCTINFAYKEGDVLCYPDLIKVGVALDDGSIVVYDTRGYLMNHKDRSFPDITTSEEKAKSVISPLLSVEKISFALIPTSGLREILCYELLCKGENDDEVLVYVNVQTGREEKILLLLKSDGGILSI